MNIPQGFVWNQKQVSFFHDGSVLKGRIYEIRGDKVEIIFDRGCTRDNVAVIDIGAVIFTDPSILDQLFEENPDLYGNVNSNGGV